jgi:hypothetical protein
VGQKLTVPSDAVSGGIGFWMNVSTYEATTSIAYDKLTIEVRDGVSGALLAVLPSGTPYSNLQAGGAIHVCKVSHLCHKPAFAHAGSIKVIAEAHQQHHRRQGDEDASDPLHPA